VSDPHGAAAVLAAAWLPLPAVAFGLSELWRRTAWWLTLSLAALVAAGVGLPGAGPEAALGDLGRGLALPLAALRGPLDASVVGARPVHARMLAELAAGLPAEGGDWRTALRLVWRGSLAGGALLAALAVSWRAVGRWAATDERQGGKGDEKAARSERDPSGGWEVGWLPALKARWAPRHGGRAATVGYDRGSGATLTIPLVYLVNHAVLLGSTGSGKTTVIEHLLDAALDAGYTAVFLDCKGDGRPRRWCRARGGLVWTIGGAVAWDAFSGTPTVVADKLVAGEMAHSDAKYFPSIMRRYLQLVAKVQDARHGAGHPRDPHEIAALLHPQALTAAVARLRQARPDLAAALAQTQAALAEDFGDDELTSKALLGFRHRFKTLLEGDAGPSLGIGAGALDVGAAVRDRVPVLFSISVEAYAETGPKVAAWALLEMIRVVSTLRDTPLGHHCLLVVDEFGQLKEEAKQVTKLLEMARSAGVGVVLATQGLSSLRDMGGDAREAKALVDTILNCCNTTGVMRLRGEGDTARMSAFFMDEAYTDPATGKAKTRPAVPAQELAALKRGQLILRTDGPVRRVVVARPRKLPPPAPAVTPGPERGGVPRSGEPVVSSPPPAAAPVAAAAEGKAPDQSEGNPHTPQARPRGKGKFFPVD
jgi:hypothetical protein